MDKNEALYEQTSRWSRRIMWPVIAILGLAWAIPPGSRSDHPALNILWALGMALTLLGIALEVASKIFHYRRTGRFPGYLLFARNRKRVAQREQQAELQHAQKDRTPVA